MIDNIKFQILDKNQFEKTTIEEKLIDLSLFKSVFTGQTAEYPKRGKLLNLDVSITNSGASLGGSIHKFENLFFLKENQNYNDFTHYQMCDLVPFLLEFFDFKMKTSLSNLELGFNLMIGQDPQILIDHNILMHDLRNHNKFLKYSGRGDYKEFMKSDYSIKIYNKSKQYKLKDNIIRIELKIIKKRMLQKLGVFTLEDLIKKDVLTKIFLMLKSEFEKVIIVDDFDHLEIPIKDLERLNKYTNPNFWDRMRKTKSLKVLRRLERDFKLLIMQYSLRGIKSELLEKLDEKFFYLLNTFEPDSHLYEKVA